MQRFTYTRHGTALRSQITMLLSILMADVVTVAVVAVLVPGWWKAAVGGCGLAFLIFAVLMLTRSLRTFHTLDDAGLQLHFGSFRLAVALAVIAGAALHAERPPRGIAVPTHPAGYDWDAETLYLLADRRGLVAVALSRPVTARVKRLGAVPVRRVVLSLDAPDAFVAAVWGMAGGGATVGGGATAATPATAPEPDRSLPTPAPVAHQPGQAAIRLVGLTKRYDGFTAVDAISLEVAPGEVLAFLGTNGAGKTTTIRMMTGLLRPTAGRVELAGQDLWAGGSAVRRLVGYVPDVPLLYEGLTAREFLWLMAGLYGLPHADGRRRTDELLAQMKLERWGDHLLRHFSLGMKRKMAIAAALIHQPRILLLDEVTNGLDPRAAREVKDLIAAAAAGGTAIFLTTHLLDVVEELATRIAIIERGRLQAIGTPEELRAQAGRPAAGLEELFLTLTGTGVSA